MSLGTGSAASMAFDGSLLTRPTGDVEQPISDALLLSYSGVYAAPPATDVLSPNGDGVDDTQTFTYKLVRASQVTASLVAPDGTQQVLAQDAEQPGVHTLQWPPEGSAAAEGNWRFSVTATDDQGRTTSAERDFLLDLTLGSLSVSGNTATFKVAHPAQVTVTVETQSGIVLATLLRKSLVPGAQQVTWRGRVRSGSRIRVTAVNSIGTVSLVAPFTTRRR
jgi:flagellar hook assembly protein FlgD